jgi:hypothetical protein
MKMVWRSGQPIDMGYYLCAIVGNNKPTELYWDGSSWGFFLGDWQPFDKAEVAYYMYLGDIPMPEGW